MALNATAISVGVTASSLLFAAAGCGGPEADATSCASFLNPGPPPGQPHVNPPIVTVTVNGFMCLTTCFHRDNEQPELVRAIRWRSLAPAIATVAPPTGQSTLVTGHEVGLTTVRADIAGSTVDIDIQVISGSAPSYQCDPVLR